MSTIFAKIINKEIPADILFEKMLSTNPSDRPTLDEIHVAFK